MALSQQKRLRKWLNLAPLKTRHLGSCVEQVLVPSLERLGFDLPTNRGLLTEHLVLGRELELERKGGEYVDTVTFSFDKYRRPRFQIYCARRAVAPPHAFLRSCNLVANNMQYYYFWGIPWWYPTAWWSNNRSDLLINFIEGRLAQLDRFLASADSGPNISKPI